MAPKPQHLVQIFLWTLCICVLYHLEYQANAATVSGQNPCMFKYTCHDCIQTPSCAWCSDPSDVFKDRRCYQPAGQQLHTWCPREYEYYPNISFRVVEQRPLTKTQTVARSKRDTGMWDTGSAGGYSSGNTQYSSVTYKNTSTSTGYSGGTTSNTGYSSSSSSGYSGSGSNAGYSGSGSNTGYSGFGSNAGYSGSTSNAGQSGSASNAGYSGSTSNAGYSGSTGNAGYSGSTSNAGYSGSINQHSNLGGDSTSYTQYTETHTTTTSTSHLVQVSPQRIHLKLRAREKYSFTMHYAQAKDYPVDLYYLMDLSKSMEDDKEKLSFLGNRLAKTMQSMTNDFQLGFGSFVDKVVMPYVSTVPSNLEHPCTNCSAPYGFKHAMKLTKTHTHFSDMVRAAQVSGNLDAPEGGFDALMQAVVCKTDIGWRSNARKLLVFSTDDGFHYAGDGKLGGIITPNDGLCHLQDDYYSYSSIQDYPSISQLNMKIKQNSINVIFAVTDKQSSIYDKLKVHIEGASSGKLSADSSNIVELVKKQFEAISSTVEMKDNATDGIIIKYYTKCIDSITSEENNTNICEGFKVGQVIDFRLEVFLKECPKDRRKWNQTIQVYPVGLSESLFIDLEMLCSCPCETPGLLDYKTESPKCSGVGTYMCGICECDDTHIGKMCECIQGTAHNTTGCKAPGSTIECSGKGTCICNECQCDVRTNPKEIISGLWCECDNYSCYRHNGQICGGHGVCGCKGCECDPNWKGDACECYMKEDTCFSPIKKNTKPCGGHGICECGACICETTEQGKYTGHYCERCPNCTETCDELAPCVLCQMYEVGPYDKQACIANCRTFTPKEVATVIADEQNSEFLCAGYDEDDCRYVFMYKEIPEYDNGTKYIVAAHKERECPAKVFLLGIVLGVIAAVVLMGLAILLLWKLLTTIHDRREFAKFEKERMMAKWDTGENPIYKQATSTFKNPTYAGKG